MKGETPKTLGGRVKALRRKREYTQGELAERSELSVPFISDVENDKRSPGSQSLLRLADALGVSMDYLMRGGEKGAPKPERERTEEELTFPTALNRAAREEGWSYEDAAMLLEARAFILARRSGGQVAKAPNDLDRGEWKDLHRLYEKFAKDR